MADAAQLMDAVRQHLLNEGLARTPGTPGPEPTVFVLPEGGAVAPGDKKGAEDHPDVVLSLFYSGGFAARPYEPFLRRGTVDFWFRAKPRGGAPIALELEQLVREAFVGSASADTFGKRNWTMGGLLVHSTQEWRSVSPVPGVEGHAFVWAMLVEYSA